MADTPLCGELRSKRYYFLDRAPERAEEILDGSNDCWCEKTMQKIGPDSELVHPAECGAARPCYTHPARPKA